VFRRPVAATDDGERPAALRGLNFRALGTRHDPLLRSCPFFELATISSVEEDPHRAFSRDNRFGRALLKNTDYDLRSFGVHRWEYPARLRGVPTRFAHDSCWNTWRSRGWIDRDDQGVMLGFAL
jgi:hypothetical protein